MAQNARTRHQKPTVVKLVMVFVASALVGYAGMGTFLLF